jgi:hypothetical protein
VAAGTPILLPSVRTALTPGPPLAGSATATAEVLFPPGMTSDERVLVGIGARGKPLSIAVVQRLVLHKLGDYSFFVQGPIADVEAAPGSDSEPGLRRDAILWSGFSSGTRTLAAKATLRVAPAAAALPLRVSIEREGNAVVLRGENTSSAPGPVLLGPVSARDAARAFGETRRRLPLGRGAPDVYVTVPRTPLSQSEPIPSPLDVQGELGGIHFRYRLGDGGPLQFERRFVNMAPRAKLRLLVTPVPPVRLLTPPGAASWAEAVRRGRVDRSRLLERVSQVRLMVARELQYQTFLANPNPNGRSSAVYVYETAKRTAAAPQSAPTDKGTSVWLTALLTGLAVLGAGGLVVLWAYS